MKNVQYTSTCMHKSWLTRKLLLVIVLVTTTPWRFLQWQPCIHRQSVLSLCITYHPKDFLQSSNTYCKQFIATTLLMPWHNSHRFSQEQHYLVPQGRFLRWSLAHETNHYSIHIHALKLKLCDFYNYTALSAAKCTGTQIPFSILLLQQHFVLPLMQHFLPAWTQAQWQL